MPTEVTVPEIGESITEVEIGEWLKQKGDRVAKDEPLVTIDSEKATLELPSPAGGVLSEILKTKGQVAKIGEVIAHISGDGSAGAPTSSPARNPRRLRKSRLNLLQFRKPGSCRPPNVLWPNSTSSRSR
jgi:2-oxoglutarate dehydrogenase E2 component (dihydrolipoamide succinyltransferase)